MQKERKNGRKKGSTKEIKKKETNKLKTKKDNLRDRERKTKGTKQIKNE
jgi:hypothetical protein